MGLWERPRASHSGRHARSLVAHGARHVRLARSAVGRSPPCERSVPLQDDGLVRPGDEQWSRLRGNGLERAGVGSVSASDGALVVHASKAGASPTSKHAREPTRSGGKPWANHDVLVVPEGCALRKSRCAYARTGAVPLALAERRGPITGNRRLAKFSRVDVLVLDDFAASPMSDLKRCALLEVLIWRRAGRVSSPLPIALARQPISSCVPRVLPGLLGRDAGPAVFRRSEDEIVGEAGFEPATSSTQSLRTTGLCDSP